MITYFHNIHQTKDGIYCDPTVLLSEIRDGGQNKELIFKIRQTASKDERNALKKDLKSICWSGKFLKRSIGGFAEHSGLICLDVDDIAANDMDIIKNVFIDWEYCHSIFLSPSGNGYKILVKIPIDKTVEPQDAKTLHLQHFRALRQDINEILNIFVSTKTDAKGNYLSVEVDKACKDVSRVCYISHDPDIFYNADSDTYLKKLDKDPRQKRKKFNEVSGSNFGANKIDLIRKWANNKTPYIEGNRNNHLRDFSGACCRYGVPQDELIFYCNLNLDLPEDEIKTTIESLYRSNDFNSVTWKTGVNNTSNEVKNISQSTLEKEEENLICFWQFNEKGRPKIMMREMIQFLESEGFRRYRNPQDKEKVFYIQIIGNIVDFSSTIDIKDCIMNYVTKNAPDNVFEELASNSKHFKTDVLNLLKEIEIESFQDTENTCTLFLKIVLL